jgi:hypothetical protein
MRRAVVLFFGLIIAVLAFWPSAVAGRSLSQDVRRKAKTVVMAGHAIRAISVATNSGAIVLLWQTSRDSSSAKPSSPNVSP